MKLMGDDQNSEAGGSRWAKGEVWVKLRMKVVIARTRRVP
jgi:hypothetical protein